jgi:hypothetical protein
VDKEQRKMRRKDLSYYLPVTEPGSSVQIGIIVDVSPLGFKLESQKPILPGEILHFRIDLSGGIGPSKSVVFVGRSKWYHPDLIDPSTYIVGFEIMDMSPEEVHKFHRALEEYAKQPAITAINRNLYPWR